MTQVTVRLYEQGDKVWRDFKAELQKRYKNAVKLDISESEAFSKIEKQAFNNLIVVSKKAIVEKRAVARVDNRDMPSVALISSIKAVNKRGEANRKKYAVQVSEAASKSKTLTEVAKRIGKSTTFVKRVASEFEIKLPRRNNGSVLEFRTET
jgi:predicted nucleic acid-binding protein